MIFDKQKKALQKIDSNMTAVVVGVIRSNEKAIVAMNREQIYDKGRTIHETPIINRRFNEARYGHRYKAYKISLGKYQGYIDLNLTGKYLRSLKLVLASDQIEIRGKRMEKGEDIAIKLRSQFPDAEGLTDRSVEVMKETIVRPGIEELIRRSI